MISDHFNRIYFIATEFQSEYRLIISFVAIVGNNTNNSNAYHYELVPNQKLWYLNSTKNRLDFGSKSLIYSFANEYYRDANFMFNAHPQNKHIKHEIFINDTMSDETTNRIYNFSRPSARIMDGWAIERKLVSN